MNHGKLPPVENTLHRRVFILGQFALNPNGKPAKPYLAVEAPTRTKSLLLRKLALHFSGTRQCSAALSD